MTPKPPPSHAGPGKLFYVEHMTDKLHIVKFILFVCFDIVFVVFLINVEKSFPQFCFILAAYNWTSERWLKWNGNEYKFVHNRMSIEQARQQCKKENSDLVSITSEAESILLWNVVSRIPCQTNVQRAQQNFGFFNFNFGLYSGIKHTSKFFLDRPESGPRQNSSVGIKGAPQPTAHTPLHCAIPAYTHTHTTRLQLSKGISYTDPCFLFHDICWNHNEPFVI